MGAIPLRVRILARLQQGLRLGKQRSPPPIEALDSGDALDKIACASGVELADVRKAVEAWEADGLVRRV